MTATIHEFPASGAIDDYLSSTIAHALEQAIITKGHANLAVSGGRTPREMLIKLAAHKLPWQQVNVVLVDERWTDIQSSDSNEHMLRDTLLQGPAADARYHSIRPEGEPNADSLADVSIRLLQADAFPFDVLTLGLGEDGHTASLFPCADEIYQAMSMDNPALLMRIRPTTAPYDRISFTLQALLQSRKVFLHATGQTKKQVIARALEGDNTLEMPVRAFLHHPSLDLEVCWAAR